MAHCLESKERTRDIKLNKNIDFSQMLFLDNTLIGLENAGFKYPSPIQLAAIPIGKCGLDLIIQAKSGTGKTLVFGIVALEMINSRSTATQVIVLAPTREIAFQIGTVLRSIGLKIPNLTIHTFIGGTSLENDKKNLKMCHIAIGTPGRIKQLIELKSLKTHKVKLFILDEADQLLNSQFIECIVEIYKFLPINKQVLAISATYSDEELGFIKKLTITPSLIMLDKESPSLIGVEQFAYCVPMCSENHIQQRKKVNMLCKIIGFLKFNQCIIFTNSQMRAESLCNQLKNRNWSVSFMSGSQKQNERLQSFQALCSYNCRIMVSTDLSARGLDSEHVNLVINIDLPSNQATYLHRIGRAGRYGSLGYAISFVGEGQEYEHFSEMVTEAKMDIKIIPKNFKKFENLQKISSDDYKTLKTFTEKLLQKKSVKKIISNEAESLKENNLVNVITKVEGKLFDDNETQHFAPKKANTESITNELDNMKLEVPTSLNETTFMPSLDKRIFLPIPISYNGIFKEYSQIDPDSKTIIENGTLQKSLLKSWPSNENFQKWKNIIDQHEMRRKLTENANKIECFDVSNTALSSQNISTTAAVQRPINYNNQSIIKGPICNGNDDPLKNKLELLMNHKEELNLDEYPALNCNPLKDILNSAECYIPSMSNGNQKDELTGFGKWCNSSQNNALSSDERTSFKHHQYSRFPVKKIERVNYLSDYSEKSSLKSEKVADHFESSKTSQICNLRNSDKFIEMMNYTRTLGRISAFSSRQYNLTN